jgi:crotonobetainyl-CoA:carnitine CoA-transferase CaiB-like acyl-CoA transferase
MAVLTGVRIVDFTSAGAGPFGTMMLSDLGAEVLKVESPHGDHSRQWGTWFVDGKSTSFLAKNRNKKSIVCDLKTPVGRADAHRLIAGADVVVESLAPGGADKLGISYAECRRTRPDLIYCSLSGFGRTGPKSDEIGMDMMLQAFCGIMSFTGEPGRPPVRIPVSAIDLMTGCMLFGGVLAALRERDQSGQGQWLEVSLYDTAMALLGWAVPTYSASKEEPKKLGGEFQHNFPYGVFTAKDGYFYLGVSSPGHWRRFCDAMGLQHLHDDPRFATNAARCVNREELRPILEEIFARKTIDELISELKPVRVAIEKIRGVGEAINDEQAEARGMVRPCPGYPDIQVVRTPLLLQRGAIDTWTRPPHLGEHTEEYLAHPAPTGAV